VRNRIGIARDSQSAPHQRTHNAYHHSLNSKRLEFSRGGFLAWQGRRLLKPKVRLFSVAASADVTKRLLQELDPGPLAPEARVIPLDQAASCRIMRCACIKYKPNSRNAANLGWSASAIYALQLTHARCPMEPRDDFFLSECPTRMRWPCIKNPPNERSWHAPAFKLY
jgi:hypothetical protein